MATQDDNKVGMTTAQKVLTFVPLAGVIVYLVAAGLHLLPPPPAPAVQRRDVYLVTETGNNCATIPNYIVISAGNQDQLFFNSDNNAYTVNFSGTYPFNEGANPIQVNANGTAGPFTAKAVAAVTYAPYTAVNTAACHGVSTDIGIVVTR